MNLEEQALSMWTSPSGSESDPVASSYEHENHCSAYVKSDELLDELSDCWLIKDSGANLTRILLFNFISVTVLSRNILGFANLKYIIVFLCVPI
jgi:hypothetical protein